ncbi:unnamed protein product [Ranitomeya imitator]|uniref:C2H2-type domain-containing protein n=1 Tax=Ranitomeya imitator TaxID=111125 RepID=A0ABN9LI08_9NEOB|nr:unnamed protein product [Ranitomeya imitator]
MVRRCRVGRDRLWEHRWIGGLPTFAENLVTYFSVSAPEFVFEHGYQTFLPSEGPMSQSISIATKCRSRKVSASSQKKQSCHYPGCPFKTAYGMKDMERHLRTHTGAKPHKCETCGKGFSRKDKLKTHMRSHTGEKPYKCKECDYSAADSSSLCKHQRIHTDERPFKCQICPYASRNSSQLTVHLRSHTGNIGGLSTALQNAADKPLMPNRRQSIHITLCIGDISNLWLLDGRTTALPDGMSSSSLISWPGVTSSLRHDTHSTVTPGDAPFHCILCNSKFKINSDLKRHMRVHTGEKPYRCEFCDFYCAMKGNLKSHIRMKHNNETEPLLKVHERIHSNDRPFKCHFCKFDTKQRSNLTTHVKKVHGDQIKEKSDPQKSEGNFQRHSTARKNNKVEAKKTFKCDLCDASFVREDSLRSHKKQHDEYIIQKNQSLSVLQLSIDPSRESVDQTAEGLSKVNPEIAIITGKVNLGKRLQDKDHTETCLENATNTDRKVTNNQLQMLSRVNLMASPPMIASQSNDVEMAIHISPVQADSDPINKELIGNDADHSQGSPANPTFINAAGMTCSDLEGLNVLIQEQSVDVTVVSVGNGDSGVPNTTSSPCYPSPPAVSPKEKYIIIQDDERPDILCPADAIPD